MRPTLLTPSLEPSEETSASTSASECVCPVSVMLKCGLITALLTVACVHRNIIHGSDSVESANKEIGLWFKQEELVSYTSCAFSWLY